MTDRKWQAPQALKEERSSFKPYPIMDLPEILREMVNSVSVTTSTDKSMAATAVLSAMSHCFSGMYRMYGKQDHSEPVNLYTLILASPAERKSPVMRFIKKPFIEFAREFNDSHKLQIFTSQEQAAKLKAEIAELQTKGASPDEIAFKRAELDSMEVEQFRRVCVDDVTPEALVKLINDNETILMMSDEAGVFKNFGGRYNNGVANLDLLLKCWGGESYQKDRCHGEPVYLDRPYLSVCLCGQPYILTELMENRAFVSSGMLARFIYCFPRSFIGMRDYNAAAVKPEFTAAYDRLVKDALAIKYNRKKGEPEIPLYFDDEARAEFAKYYNKSIEPSLLTDFADCPDWGGKFHGLILRLCGLLHCIKCIVGGRSPQSEQVTLITLMEAIELAEYYKHQAIYAYGMNTTGAVADTAEYVLNKLKTKKITRISSRELLRSCRRFKKVAELEEPMELLIDRGYAVAYEESGTLWYEVNPMI